ncbi:MAG: pyrrolo-quinoline quinone [Verrucomicrobia bacterium]|nr:pyrrolo-quinoline quinone [Verrucomicrobiota bacterium]
MKFKWLALAAVLLAASPVLATDVLTFHNNSARTGLNDHETILTPTNVSQDSFGLLFNLSVDGKVDAQPLYVSSVPIRGVGRRNVVIVATEHDSVYAFDADAGTLYWHVSVLAGNEVPSDQRGCEQITPEIGISATPVIIRPSDGLGTIYLVAMSKSAATKKTVVYHQRLHALSLADGSEIAGSPVEIEASFPGKGPGNDGGGHVIFKPANYKETAALLLNANIVYTAWTSHCDMAPYTGWIIGYHVHSLTRVNVLNVDPNGRPTSSFLPDGSGNSFSGSGAGLSVDNNGFLYGLTENGPFGELSTDGFPKNGDYGDTFLRISPQSLKVVDYFTPYNQPEEAENDTDLGSGGTLVLPEMTTASGEIVHLVVGAGKGGNIYVVNRNHMGKINQKTPDNSNVYQEIQNALGGAVFGSPAYFDGHLFYGPVNSTLKQFTFHDGLLSTNATSATTNSFDYRGTTPSISSSGSGSGIVWAYENAHSGDAILHAYNALDLTQELYNTKQAPNGRDAFGAANKFIVPTICNGKVFVGTTNSIGVFGLLAVKAPQNVTESVKIDREEDPADREEDTIALKISLTNTGTQTITGPISLVFDDLNRESYVSDPDGSTTTAAPTGSFYVDFTPTSGELVKDQTETRFVRFRSATETVQYRPRVLAGAGIR